MARPIYNDYQIDSKKILEDTGLRVISFNKVVSLLYFLYTADVSQINLAIAAIRKTNMDFFNLSTDWRLTMGMTTQS